MTKRTHEPILDTPARGNSSGAQSPTLQEDGRSRSAPPSLVNDARHTRLFGPDASIVILGIRGTGKTTLGIVASVALGFRLVDADQLFLESTGLSRAAFQSSHGAAEYRRREVHLLRALLQRYPTRSIIICGPGSVEGTGQELIREFGASHPVVYVIRDAAEVDRYLKTNNPRMIENLEKLVNPIYRSLSNYEFFNLSELSSEGIAASTELSGPPLGSHPSLILKPVEKDFLALIYNIRNRNCLPEVREARHSVSFLAPEFKPFTYALQLPLSQVSALSSELRRADLVADAVELVIDIESFLSNNTADPSLFNYITRQYYLLRRIIRLPVIVNFGLPESSAHNAESTGLLNGEALYLRFLSHGLRLAPEYLVIDLKYDLSSITRLIATKGSTKILGHFHESNPVADAWKSPSRLSLLEVAGRMGCDLVRVSQPSTSAADNIALRNFSHHALQTRDQALPLISYNTDFLGRSSVFQNSILTPVTHDLIRASSDPPPPWLITVQEAQNALYASFMLDKMNFGIFGAAISSALSPAMHNAAFKFCGMPHHYSAHQSSTLRVLEDAVKDPSFGGASVTLPFKKEIIIMLDYLSPEAQAIGAVNTVLPLRERALSSLLDRNKRGHVKALFGDNTDWIGIHTCISRSLSPVNSVKSRSTALIIGAGGMAQAAIYALIRLGVKNIFIHNRTMKNAEALVSRFHQHKFAVHNLRINRATPTTSPDPSGLTTPNVDFAGPANIHLLPSMNDPWPAGYDMPTIIISCIPGKGVNGQPPPNLTLPQDWLRSPTGGVMIELAYDPPETPLLKQMRELRGKGWIAVHGLQVLPEQGIAQFELFTGRKAPQNLMRAEVWKHRVPQPFLN